MKHPWSGEKTIFTLFLSAMIIFTSCSSKQNRKLIVVGIDGYSPGIVNELISKGSLPVYERLQREGVSGEITSTIPPLEPTAWTSSVTGTNPGQHGLFCYSKGFTMQDDYLVNHYNSALDRNIPPVWNLLSDEGIASVVINVPFTSPPDSIDGLFVAGGPHPDPGHFAVPAELGELFPGDYTLTYTDEAWKDWRGQEYLDYVYRIYNTRKKSALELLRSEDWDLFFVVFTIPERIQRYYWHHRDGDHPLHSAEAPPEFRGAVEEIYGEMDRLLEEFDREAASLGANLIVFSPYGMRPVYRELLGENFIHANWPPEDRDIFITNSDKLLGLFSITFSKPPEVTRENWEKYSNISGELLETLNALVDPETGEAVIDTVYHRANLYTGQQQVKAPDVIAVEKDGYLFVNWHRTDDGDVVVQPLPHTPSAHHSLQGLILAKGPDIGSGRELSGVDVTDITPTILYLCGAPIPTYLDGTVMEDLIRKDFLTRNPVSALQREVSPDTRKKVRTSTEEEEQNLREQLQGLGTQ